tara:strand:- start:30 stop:440 length:411 start_codon:yes stop_codon:yes gene_type:complete
MKLNINDLEERLNNISKDLEESKDDLKDIATNIYNKEPSNIHHDIIKESLDDGEYEYEYYLMNEKYKQWISQYSKEYIEMSDWYYGSELPYDIYCKEFKKVNTRNNYLENPKEVLELYFLFIFFAMYQHTIEEMKY